MSADGLLVLFDCDGTLFVGHDELTQPAMIEALQQLTGCEIPDDAFDELDHSARPARWLARETLEQRGLRRSTLTRGLPSPSGSTSSTPAKGRPAAGRPPTAPAGRSAS